MKPNSFLCKRVSMPATYRRPSTFSNKWLILLLIVFAARIALTQRSLSIIQHHSLSLK